MSKFKVGDILIHYQWGLIIVIIKVEKTKYIVCNSHTLHRISFSYTDKVYNLLSDIFRNEL